MAFTKITEADLHNKGVIGLPDTPGLSTTEMQEKFDEIALEVLYPKHNGLIDEMEASTAAASIGAKDANGNDSNIQTELNNIKQGGYTKTETDALLANKVDTISGKGLSTNDFTDAYKTKLNNIEDNANNYVLPKGTQSTIGGVMGDGTTFTIDSNGVGHAVGGGGGGTSDYSALINKPSINHVELIGDKDGSEFGFLSPIITITSDAGSTVKIKKGTTEIVAVQKTTTTWEAIPSSYGTWQVISSLAGADDATGTVDVDTVKKYSTTVQHITATITATYPSGATCRCYKGATEYIATSNPQTFTVRSLGTWYIETTYNGIVKTATATISADGDSQSVTIEYATINVTYDNNFRGKTITCTDGTSTYTKTAPSDANTVSFTIPSTGTWTVRGEVGGVTYSQNVVVSSYTSYSASLAVFNATITATFPASEGATCVCNGVTATTSPYTFNIGSTGTYSVVCTLDGVSMTESVTITTDGQSESKTFTYGTINLTYANEFRGLTITCVKGGTTISKTAPSASNSLTFYPDTTGEWTISGTYSGVTYSTSATVSSLSTAVSALLQTVPDGSTVTPTDDIQKWLACAAITDKTYTTLNEVLADSTTLLALMSDNNAVDYLVRSTTWASGVTANSTAMTDIGANNYCANTLLDDATWCTAICNSTYFESVLTVKVPTMTSATTPSGEVIYSTQLNASFAAFKAFDGVDTYDNSWYPADGSQNPSWVGYDFGTSVKIYFVRFYQNYANAARANTCKYQASTDNSTWVDISSVINVGTSGTAFDTIIPTNMVMSGRYVRIYWTPTGHCGISEIQFYGR